YHHDRDAYEGRVGAGVRGAGKSGEEDGDSGLSCRTYTREASIRSVHNLPTHNRNHNFPRKLPSIKRSIVRQRPRFRGFERPAFLGIEDGYVCGVAARQRATAAEIENARRASGKEFNDTRQRDLVL